ncbi:hypothetical protein ACFFWD_42020 [Bradyrhizobium erythrophlei]|uniref:hypothetical protein n=1 Tax=Bradyrhizobium erythrophlei TaxID=1437360 RepID=UPI0035ED9E58
MSWFGRMLGKRDDSDLGYTSEERKIFASSFRIGWTVVAFGIAGLAAMALWADGARTAAEVRFTAFFGADLLVAAASASAGALLGFVFGIPRTLDPAGRAAVATATSQGGAGAASNAIMAANTNLERISDWLTTLLIGATLVQIKDLAAWIGGLGKGLLQGGATANDAIIPVIVIYFFALAFLGVYLITRLYLTSAFVQTLGMLAGAPVGSDPKVLTDTLDAALASGKFEDLRSALVAYDASALLEADRANPQLNARLARVAAQSIAAGTPTGRIGNPVAELKAFVIRATADPISKASLKADLDAQKITTRNVVLDRELGALLT